MNFASNSGDIDDGVKVLKFRIQFQNTIKSLS